MTTTAQKNRYGAVRSRCGTHQHLVGHLWRNATGAIGFRYDPQWITQGGFAFSHTLPLGSDDFTPEDSVAHRFFANLLPEGGVRERIVRDLKISNTDFNLLRTVFAYNWGVCL